MVPLGPVATAKGSQLLGELVFCCFIPPCDSQLLVTDLLPKTPVLLPYLSLSSLPTR